MKMVNLNLLNMHMSIVIVHRASMAFVFSNTNKSITFRALIAL